MAGDQPVPDLEQASDIELIQAARRDAAAADRCLEALYSRYYRRVAYWCLKICGSRGEASDLAQEVFLRVHSRLDTFRLESSFSTWLYTVVRSVAINRGRTTQRRQLTLVPARPDAPDPVDPAPDAAQTVERGQLLDRVRELMATRLEPLEAKVMYLHHVDGLTLPAITQLLSLENKSGAKAYIVSGLRKLKRELGREIDSAASTSE